MTSCIRQPSEIYCPSNLDKEFNLGDKDGFSAIIDYDDLNFFYHENSSVLNWGLFTLPYKQTSATLALRATMGTHNSLSILIFKSYALLLMNGFKEGVPSEWKATRLSIFQLEESNKEAVLMWWFASPIFSKLGREV